MSFVPLKLNFSDLWWFEGTHIQFFKVIEKGFGSSRMEGIQSKKKKNVTAITKWNANNFADLDPFCRESVRKNGEKQWKIDNFFYFKWGSIKKFNSFEWLQVNLVKLRTIRNHGKKNLNGYLPIIISWTNMSFLRNDSGLALLSFVLRLQNNKLMHEIFSEDILFTKFKDSRCDTPNSDNHFNNLWNKMKMLLP